MNDDSSEILLGRETMASMSATASATAHSEFLALRLRDVLTPSRSHSHSRHDDIPTIPEERAATPTKPVPSPASRRGGGPGLVYCDAGFFGFYVEEAKLGPWRIIADELSD